ncbi:GNAT family N-acetyltransferase [Actinoplanes sp. CA-252034]|uniref:GNAT family N-acetyltransferase n=1 Tax=Actinoplanes sp. CA-252034 TaxID=3239906 RepID=UPI003D9728BD
MWRESGAEVLSRAELEAKLVRDPELFLVAEAGEQIEIAGVVLGTYDGRRGWIFRLGVHPDHRRRRVASRLVAELENRFQALGCPASTCWCGRRTRPDCGSGRPWATSRIRTCCAANRSPSQEKTVLQPSILGHARQRAASRTRTKTTASPTEQEQ